LFLSSTDEKLLQEKIAGVEEIFGNKLLPDGGDSIAGDVLRLLREKNFSLATAESCTGGMISSELTAISGSSDVYKGSFITYSNESKEKLLGVSCGFRRPLDSKS
jgi:nicotinamide-nucleotide amidase